MHHGELGELLGSLGGGADGFLAHMLLVDAAGILGGQSTDGQLCAQIGDNLALWLRQATLDMRQLGWRMRDGVRRRCLGGFGRELAAERGWVFWGWRRSFRCLLRGCFSYRARCRSCLRWAYRWFLRL